LPANEAIASRRAVRGYLDRDVPLDMVLPTIPLRRMGKPEELTAAIVYLAGYGASFTTGTDLVIDGAFTCA